MRIILVLGSLVVSSGLCCTHREQPQKIDGNVTTFDSTVAHENLEQDDDGVDGLDASLRIDSAQPNAWAPAGKPDLVLNLNDLRGDIWFDHLDVEEDSCALLEGCILATGRRRLLRFSVATGNMGSEDYFVGPPDALGDAAVFSPCHEHFHYADFANYALERDGRVVQRGHKQAFCLMDTRPMNGVLADSIRPQARYNCRYQGISPGWEDVYGSELDCQWVDITDLPEGDYELVVRINPERTLKEARLDNNDGRVRVTIPVDDLTRACGDEARTGTKRSCGWTLGRTVECQADRLVQVGGGGCYELGSCIGRPVIRACRSEDGACSSGIALAESDEGCGDSQCPYMEVRCPPSGRFNVWQNFTDPEEERMRLDAVEAPLSLAGRCTGRTPNGASRICGWSKEVMRYDCIGGRTYRVGCVADFESCSPQPVCEGDPIMRVCPADTVCFGDDSLAEGDDACSTRCPQTQFMCPPSGSVDIFLGSYEAEDTFSCELKLVLL